MRQDFVAAAVEIGKNALIGYGLSELFFGALSSGLTKQTGLALMGGAVYATLVYRDGKPRSPSLG